MGKGKEGKEIESVINASCALRMCFFLLLDPRGGTKKLPCLLWVSQDCVQPVFWGQSLSEDMEIPPNTQPELSHLQFSLPS